MPIHIGSNIVIDGSSFHDWPRVTKYETAVHQELLCVLGFDVGRAVINEVWSKPGGLRIHPWRNRHEVNAEASALNPPAATLPHQRVRSGVDGHVLPGWPRGTGRGSDVSLAYSPWNWGHDAYMWDATARNNFAELTGFFPANPGQEAGEVLLHELVHALRAMSGRENSLPMGRAFDTQEEFYAILVTNIYTSERGAARSLRGDHGMFAAANPQEWRTDPEFQALIRSLATSQPSLVHRLARVKAAFNPFNANYGPTR
jgi:hypothetical protein